MRLWPTFGFTSSLEARAWERRKVLMRMLQEKPRTLIQLKRAVPEWWAVTKRLGDYRKLHKDLRKIGAVRLPGRLWGLPPRGK